MRNTVLMKNSTPESSGRLRPKSANKRGRTQYLYPFQAQKVGRHVSSFILCTFFDEPQQMCSQIRHTLGIFQMRRRKTCLGQGRVRTHGGSGESHALMQAMLLPAHRKWKGTLEPARLRTLTLVETTVLLQAWIGMVFAHLLLRLYIQKFAASPDRIPAGVRALCEQRRSRPILLLLQARNFILRC
jgi:hypothetical protein